MAHLLLEAIQQYCETNRNDENIKKYGRFFKDEYKAYGLTTPQIHAFAKGLKTTFAFNDIIAASQKIIPSDMFEEPAILMSLAFEHRKSFTAHSFSHIEGWFNMGIRNWAHADMLGMKILPEFLMRNIVTTDAFIPWLVADNSFQRRCVPVTMIKYVKKNPSAIPGLFPFLEGLMMDGKREVHQGVGWYLREAWQLMPDATENFLSKWKDDAPRIIFQYACEKMSLTDKEQFRRTKKTQN